MIKFLDVDHDVVSPANREVVGRRGLWVDPLVITSVSVYSKDFKSQGIWAKEEAWEN